MSLSIEQRGNPDGQPLVLLHGWGLSSDVWHSWLPALADDYRLLLVDLPGLGRSGFDESQSYSLDAVADQVLQQLHRQEQPLLDRPAVWIGWSLGGLVAARIARQIFEQDPAAIAGLITIATSPCFVQSADWPDAMAASTFGSFQQSLAANRLKTLNRFVMLQGQGDPAGRQLVKMLKPIAAACAASTERTPSIEKRESTARIEREDESRDMPDYLAASLALLAGDYRPLFGSLNLPRLFLFAENDALVPVAVSQQPLLADHSQVVAAAGHVPFITAEPELTAMVKHWLQELDHG